MGGVRLGKPYQEAKDAAKAVARLGREERMRWRHVLVGVDGRGHDGDAHTQNWEENVGQEWNQAHMLCRRSRQALLDDDCRRPL